MRVVLSPVKHILKSVYTQMVLLPLAFLYYVLKLRRKGSFHLIVCNHIGDFMFTMGYINAYREQNGLSRITVIAAGKFEPVFERYRLQNVSFCACPTGWLKRMEEVNRHVSGRLMYRGLSDILVVAPGTDYRMGFDSVLPIADMAGLTLKDFLAYGNMSLRPGACYETLPVTNGKSGGGRKILLCPDAQMLRWKERETFFETFRETAGRAGYETDINRMGDSGGLDAFLDRCPEYVAVVGLRSGLLDLACAMGVFTVALYPPEYAAYMNFYNMEKMNPRASCAQYLLTGRVLYDVKQILNMCEVGK